VAVKRSSGEGNAGGLHAEGEGHHDTTKAGDDHRKVDEKAENLRVEESIGKADLIEKIAEKLNEPKRSYATEVRDGKGKLRTKFKVAEWWIYRIQRISPPGTQQEGYEEMKRRGNQTRPLLNRSSLKAWG
jgi:hypothetical protein